MLDQSARIALLEARIVELQDHVAELEASIIEPVKARVPPEWGLTRSERLLFLCLRKDAVVDRDTILGVLYASRNAWPEPKILDVMMHKIRKKLKPFQIVIETDWGHGYILRDQVYDLAEALPA